MNEAVALAPRNIIGLDDLLALVGVPSKRKSAIDLSAIESALKRVSSMLDEMLLECIAAQTHEEFTAAREKVFRHYAKTVISLAFLVDAVVPARTIERVSDESFCEMESEFRESGLARFGGPIKDQAMFTIWTLRRTSRLIAKISTVLNPTEEQAAASAKLSSEFVFFTTWTQFHLDCLLAAIRFNRSVQMSVLPEIIEGLRAAVNAYGFARQGLNLVKPEVEPVLVRSEWDAEDQELLNSSMLEMARESIDDWQPEAQRAS